MRKYIYIVIVAIGLLQIVGYILNNKAIRGLGMASASAPLPIVFTEVKGVETFAADFFIEYENENGVFQKEQITPEMYSRLKGPYNRRNIYGAAISYGPILNPKMLNSILDYGLCRSVLLDEMGFSREGKNHSIKIKTRTFGRNNEWVLKPNCTN